MTAELVRFGLNTLALCRSASWEIAHQGRNMSLGRMRYLRSKANLEYLPYDKQPPYLFYFSHSGT